MKTIFFRIAILLLITSNVSVAQSSIDEYNFGENKVETQGYYQKMKTLVKAKEYTQAIEPCRWLLKNVPNFHVNLYKYGHKIYEQLEKTETKEIRKKEFQDTALYLYDQRKKYFGDDAAVMNLKGLKAYAYWYNRKDKADELYELYQSIYLLTKQDIYPGCAASYMYLAQYRLKTNKISESEFRGIYINLTDALSKQIDTLKEERFIENAQKYYDKIERVYTGSAELNCDIIIEIFGKRFQENKDLPSAKRFYSLMRRDTCLTDPLFIEALKFITKQEPNAGGMIAVGRLMNTFKELDSAIVYFKEAEKISRNEKQKGEIYLELAKVYSKKGLKTTARDYALKTIQKNIYQTEAHNIIGNLYFYSYDSCKSGDELRDRAVYIAAYNQFKAAGNQKMMTASKQQFPDMEAVHERNKDVGDEILVGCWINEKVKIQVR